MKRPGLCFQIHFQTLNNVVIVTTDEESTLLLSNRTYLIVTVKESPDDSDTSSIQIPVYSFTLTGPFLISEHEVTVSQSKASFDAEGFNYTYTITSDKWTYYKAGIKTIR